MHVISTSRLRSSFRVNLSSDTFSLIQTYHFQALVNRVAKARNNLSLHVTDKLAENKVVWFVATLNSVRSNLAINICATTYRLSVVHVWASRLRKDAEGNVKRLRARGSSCRGEGLIYVEHTDIQRGPKDCLRARYPIAIGHEEVG